MNSITPFPPDCARRFMPVRQIGIGGFSTVWIAKQSALNRLAVVKLLATVESPDDTIVERFLDEAKITAQLSHPNIVVIYDHGFDEGVPWIALEYLPGQTLRECLKTGPMPFLDAVKACCQIAAALEAAHSKGIIHRDIKPSNVIEARPGVFKVTDFGLARWAMGTPVRTKTGTILGTWRYLPPEMIKTGQAVAESDLYSLGITLFELLTTEIPFPQDSDKTIIEHHLSTPPRSVTAIRPGLPPSLDEIIQKALAKRPDQRYRSAEEMRHALESLIDSPPPVLTSISSRTPVDRKPMPERPRSGQAVSQGQTSSTMRTVALVVTLLFVSAALLVFWRHIEFATGPNNRSSPSPLCSRATPGSPLIRVDRIRIVTAPPRGATIWYELTNRANAAARYRVVGEKEIYQSGLLKDSSGALRLSGLVPGQRYTFSVEDSIVSTAAGFCSFEMPRPLVAWLNVARSSFSLGICLHMHEPSDIEVSLNRWSDGKLVYTGKERGGHSFFRIVRNLQPATSYVLRLRPIDSHRYLARAIRESQVKTQDRQFAATVETCAKNLTSGDARVRDQAAAMLLNAVDLETVPALVKAIRLQSLDQNRPAATMSVLMALGLIHDPRALPALVEALRGKSDTLVAAEALGKLFRPDGFEPIIDAVKRGLFRPEWNTASTVAHALVDCDPVRSAQLFRRIVTDFSSRSTMERLVALYGIGRLGLTEVALAVADTVLADPATLTIPAVEAMGAHGGESCRHGLRKILEGLSRKPISTDPIMALRAMAAAGSDEETSSLDPYLGSKMQPLVRAAAAFALGSIGGTAAIERLILLLDDPDPAIRRTAYWGLGRLRARKALDRLLQKVPDPDASRGRLPRALGLIGDRRAIPALLRTATLAITSSSRVTPSQILDGAEALCALGRLGDPAALPILQRALRSDLPWVRVFASEGLALLGDSRALNALTEAKQKAGERPIVIRSLTRSIDLLRSGRRQSPPLVIVDPLVRFEQSGVHLALDERVRVAVHGLWAKDLTAVSQVDGSGMLEPNAHIKGFVGFFGRSWIPKDRILHCTAESEGELGFICGANAPLPDAVGFASLSIDRVE